MELALQESHTGIEVNIMENDDGTQGGTQGDVGSGYSGHWEVKKKQE
ncbi:hypothetical protein [Prevotella sp.]|nr:hypothetical protein [Prevotella sp.]